jgi:hypothetical protein
MLTDWGKEQARLSKLTKREIIEHMAELGFEDLRSLGYRTNGSLIDQISRATASKYDRDGMVLNK